jgi:alcohol dehydrogenase
MLALEAIQILAHYLPQVIRDLENIEIRSYCLYASLLAGIAIAQTGTTLIHGMGYKLTARLGLTHGRANGILLPWVSEFNLQTNPLKYALLAKSLGEEVKGQGQEEAARRSVNGIRRILAEVGLPEKLNREEIGKHTIEEFAKEIIQNKRRLSNNPRLATLEDVVGIYEKALGNHNQS